MIDRLKWLGGLILVFFAVSCVEPAPLYGAWADNRGNTISFLDDDTFNAKISGEFYSGRYTLLLNTMTINCNEIELQIVTEWDIRGNILYLHWITANGDKLSLELFKISN